MATQFSRNNSHRRLINEKTNQLIDIRKITPKSTITIKNTPLINVSENKNSIAHDQLNTSLELRLRKQTTPQLEEVVGKPAYFVRRRNCSNSKSRSNVVRFRSVDNISTKANKEASLKSQFSVRRISLDNGKKQISSVENIESVRKKQINNFLKPRSQNLLRQTLKKTSSKQLKIKVKDPFEKRKKLDNEFADASIIQKNDQDDSVMLSTINKEEFKDLLSRIL